MATTVNSLLASLARLVDPYCNDTGQEIQDSTQSVTITGAANNGSGLIRITAANHGFLTGHRVYISGVTGTTEANNTTSNPYWTVTYVSTSTFDLQSSTFTNAWVSGGTAVGAMVGSVGGAFPAQRLLDIYNLARVTVAQVIERSLPRHLRNTLAGDISASTSLTFSGGTVAKPDGVIEVIRLEDSTKDQVTVLPMDEYENVKDLESSTVRFVFDYGGNYVARSGSTYVTDGTYTLFYRKIAPFTISDVLGASTTETIGKIFHPLLLEEASRIALGQGALDLQGLTEAVVTAAKGAS